MKERARLALSAPVTLPRCLAYDRPAEVPCDVALLELAPEFRVPEPLCPCCSVSERPVTRSPISCKKPFCGRNELWLSFAPLTALVGDASDNLPAVPGIGAATAGKLLASRQNCLELLDDLASLGSARLRDTLQQHREQILRTERLASLREDAPISDTGPLWAVPSASGLRAVGSLFEELEIKSLLGRLASLIDRHASC